MSGETGHYYDNSGYEFSHILKDVSGQTSIIYNYDPDWTPLADSTHEYWTTEDMSKVRFHGQIMTIDKIDNVQQYITRFTGKNVEISVNEYPNQIMSHDDLSSINILNVPFIGKYSTETIYNTSMKVFDLFEYIPSKYIIENVNNSSETYEVLYDSNTDTYTTIDPVTFEPLTFYIFSYNGTNWKITSPSGNDTPIYSTPSPVYKYNRLKTFTYPEVNKNNIFADRGTFAEGEGGDIEQSPTFIPIKIEDRLNM